MCKCLELWLGENWRRHLIETFLKVSCSKSSYSASGTKCFSQATWVGLCGVIETKNGKGKQDVGLRQRSKSASITVTIRSWFF